jgi:intracellular sulfur oxidation DsrE/DsrF family protein
VLDAKGGENKGQSDKWISYHLREFENSRIELFVCQNSVIVSLVKSWLLVGRSVDYEKKGVFEILNQFLLE